MTRFWHLLTLAVILVAHASMPFYEGCRVGMAFSLPGGCADVTVATLDLPSCNTEGVGPDQACVESSPVTEVHPWSQKVSSFEEATSLVEAAVKAEGGGWGVHVSAGIEGMMKSAVSSSATSFVLGDTRYAQEQTIRNKNARKLSPSAKQLLQENPQEFVKQHGRRYVSSITLGGTFGGAVSIHQNSVDVQSSLEAFASLSYQEVFSVSAEYKSAQTESSSMTKVVSNFNAEGGDNIVLPLVDGPAQIQEAYEKWQSTISETPKPLLLTTRSWADLEEVQRILLNSSQETKDLFQFPGLIQVTEESMSKEYARLKMLLNDVSGAQDWKEVKQNAAWKERVDKLAGQIRVQQSKFQLATEENLFEVQKQLSTVVDSPVWFKAEDLEDTWKKFQDDLLKFERSRSLPVFRYVLTDGWDFEYTASNQPFTRGMKKDVRVQFYCPPKDATGAEPVFSYFNREETDHRFLMDGHWKSRGWAFQGVAFWAFKQKRDGTVAVFEAWSPSASAHKYVLDSRLAGSTFNFDRKPMYYVYKDQDLGRRLSHTGTDESADNMLV